MSTIALPENRTNKLLGLEAIRFCCALAVLFWHYQHFWFVGGEPVGFDIERQPLYFAFSPLYKYGYFGVTIFWCISGFIFFWKYKRVIADGTVGYAKFLVLRFSRLYPLHLATLLLVAVLQIAYYAHTRQYFVFQKNDLLHFVLQLFFASNWASATSQGDSFNGPIWSISVEVLIYVAFFLLLRKAGGSAYINAAILLLCFLAKLARIQTPIVDCLAFFYAGGLSAIALRHFEATGHRRILRVIALFIVFAEPAVSGLTRIHESPHFPFLFLITYIPVLLYVCAITVAVGPLVQRLVEAAGNMTYSSYLVHFPIQLAIVLYFSYTGEAIPYEQLRFFGGFFLVTLLASYFVFRFFEMPAQGYIRTRYKEGRLPGR